jgi:hypothetical protein
MMQQKLLKKILQECKPIISCAIGTSYYHGLCDIGASISVIPYTLYLEIKSDIDPIEMEETCMTVQLANKEYISPLGMVGDVEVLVGKIKCPADFIVLGCSQDSFCPIIFGGLFLHTVGARIDLTISLSSLVNIWIRNYMLRIKWRPLLV